MPRVCLLRDSQAQDATTKTIECIVVRIAIETIPFQYDLHKYWVRLPCYVLRGQVVSKIAVYVL